MESFFFFFFFSSLLSVLEDAYVSQLIMSIRIYALDLSFTLHCCFSMFVMLFVCLPLFVRSSRHRKRNNGMRVGGYREVVCRIFPILT